jgi:hypothetical protein
VHGGAREQEACPAIGPHWRDELAHRAIEDALDVIVDIRDLDPRQVYGRLVLWGRETPARLVTALFACAAMHNPDTPAGELERNIRSAMQPRATTLRTAS